MKRGERVNKLAELPFVHTLDDLLHGVAQAVFKEPGGPVENFLHGTWLGHPLHPVLTDIPVGAWTAGAVLDIAESATGNSGLGSGADLAIGVGLAGASSAALAGLADWGRMGSGDTKRVGALHAALNITATVLYLLSLFARKGGNRGTGKLLAFTGYGIAGFSAYLGGHMVFAEQIGVDHTADKPKPEKFTSVLPEAELMEGQLRRVDVDGAQVLLTRYGGRIYAISDVCSHLGCSLAEGHLEGESVRCDCHGSRYALQDGKVLDGPSAYFQPAYKTRIYGGQIQVGSEL
jgi:nitrite reductase/ring-hydroxylating ferredoxin subunit/uncharacterized membrane protein